MSEDNEKDLPVKKNKGMTLDTFDITSVKYQQRLLYHVKNTIKYETGAQVILSSGGVGTGKTSLACHLIWLHLMENPGAYVGIGRKDMKRLKSTLVVPLLSHAPAGWKPGKHYFYNKASGILTLKNGSRLALFSWADGNLDRFKGEQFTFFCMDEASENTEEVFNSIYARLGRVASVNECIFLMLTNPDDDTHWINTKIIANARFIDGKRQEGDDDVKKQNYHVFYSLTKDNEHNLKQGYIEGLLANNHAKWIQRNLEGKWVSFGGDGIYFAYNESIHYKANDYVVDVRYPIYICCDFNISQGKPHSWCFAQYINDVFHFFDEIIIEGASTSKMCDEMHNRGLLNYPTRYIVNGDATGFAKKTVSGYSDYDIIKGFLSNYKKDGSFSFKMEIGTTNPDVKVRHNVVNAYLMNGLGQSRVIVYKKCVTLNQAFKLTKLKDGSHYQERDDNKWQHVGTGAGYCICKNVGVKATASVIKF